MPVAITHQISKGNQADPSLLHVIKAHKLNTRLNSIALSQNHEALVSCGSDNLVIYSPISHLLSATTSKPSQTVKSQPRTYKFVGHTDHVNCVAFHPDRLLVASASRDSTVRLWTPTASSHVTTAKAHHGAVWSVQFNYDNGHQLVTCGDDKAVKLWSVGGSQPLRFKHSLLGHTNYVRSAQFDPLNESLLLSGGNDKLVKLWDQRMERSCVMTMYEHSAAISKVQFHPSGKLVASCSAEDGSINVWDIRQYKPPSDIIQQQSKVVNQHLPNLIQHYPNAHTNVVSGKENSGVNSVAFGGSDGQFMVSTGLDNTVKIWDLQEGQIVYTLQGHKRSMTCDANFLRYGGNQYLASCADDGQVYLWRCGSFLSASTTITAAHQRIQSRSSMRNSSRSRSVSPSKSTDSDVKLTGKVELKHQKMGHEVKLPDKSNNNQVKSNVDKVQRSRSPLSRGVQQASIHDGKTQQNSVERALKDIVSQLTLLTKTVSLLEKRIHKIEQRKI